MSLLEWSQDRFALLGQSGHTGHDGAAGQLELLRSPEIGILEL